MPTITLPTRSTSPPRAPPVKYNAPIGTRWEKEKAAAEEGAFEFPEDAKYVGPWIIGECVGRGASGRVRIAKHRVTGQLAAVKILPLQPLISSRASLATQQAKSEKQRLGIDREIIMMKLMNHPNVMRIYDVYEGDKELYLVLEYVEGGELFDFLVNRGKLHTLEALAYFKQIVYGLNYAHAFSIIHRDLKPENILIHSLNPPLIKIADWGMAAFAPPEWKLETSCGSPHYASPEIVNGSKYEGSATDIWSCGVILYALLSGRLPFDDKNIKTLLLKVKVGTYDMPSHINPQAKDLLARMLVVDVDQRITIPEILNHPWLRNVTPGILYVPAPPVADLARPLRSASHIDNDLFESLVVIWGRRADREDLQADLLSPPGSGTLAKAFYFLLHMYREHTLKDTEILDATTADGKVVTKQYTAPPIRGSMKPTAVIQVRSDREAPAPPASNPTAISTPQAAIVPPLRVRPTSPVGPRLQRMRPLSSPPPRAIPPKNHRAVSGITAAEKAIAIRRSSAAPPQLPSLHIPNEPVFQSMNVGERMPNSRRKSAGSPQSPDYADVSAPSPRPTIFAPIPLPAGPHQPLMPLLKAPRIANVEFQRRLDDITERVNVLVANENAVHQQAVEAVDGFVHVDLQGPNDWNGHRRSSQGAQGQGYVHAYSPANFMLPEGFVEAGGIRDKENKGRGRATSYSGVDPMQISGGLFGKRAGGDLVKGKDKRRPPPLETGIQRRKTIGTQNGSLGSPAMSVLASPVVEVKGWFSNLFTWKPQSYTLCSTNDIVHTRNETIRLLEKFSVIVALEDTDGCGQLRCRIDDLVDASTGTTLQKASRFRVEIYSTNSEILSPQPEGGQSSQSTPPIPVVATGGPKHGINKQMAIGSQCAIALIHEKGSGITFKGLCRRLRDEWNLDALQSLDTPAMRSDVA